MDSYCCNNSNLNCILEIIKSPEGINAVWNKDDNTVYCNKECIDNIEKKLNQRKFLSINYENNEKNQEPILDDFILINNKYISEKENELYIAINESRLNNPLNNPVVKIV